jgi:hypothetical protein
LTRGPTTFYGVRTAGVVLVGNGLFERLVSLAGIWRSLVSTGLELYSIHIVPLCLQSPPALQPRTLHASPSVPVPSSYVAVCCTKIIITNSVRAVRPALSDGSSELAVWVCRISVKTVALACSPSSQLLHNFYHIDFRKVGYEACRGVL